MAWPDDIPTEVVVEHDGKQVPLREQPFVKETPDLATFAKRAWDAHREVGARVPVKLEMERNADGTFRPKAEAVTKWRNDHLPKLYDAGILDRPPAQPAEYGIKRPDGLPEGLGWSDELATKLAGVLHKHGVPKAAVGELLDIHIEGVLGAHQALKTSFDEGMAALRAEHGDKLQERMEAAKRLTPVIFKTPEELEFVERLGLGNHPGFLNILLRLAPLALQDSSIIDATRPTGSMTADDVKGELTKIMNDKTHPMYAGYQRGDPKVMAHIDGLYKKAFGEGKVDLGGGIEVRSKPA